MSDEDGKKQPRGFAALKAAGRGAEVSAIARRGGVAAHEQGTAHEWDHDAAVEAGRKGGREYARRKREAAAK